MRAPIEIRYDAPPTVSRFLASDAFVRVIEGPIGSGKSSGCDMEILKRALGQRPGPDGIRRSRGAIIRNTYPELRDTTRRTFEEWIPAELGGWNKEEFSFRMRFRDVDCEVLFRALDRPQDIKKLLSLELTFAYFNELREIPKEIFDMMQGRVGRFPAKKAGGPSWFGVWGDTNPWQVGHWLDDLFRGEPEGMELFVQPDGLGPEAENVENLPDGYYARLCSGKDQAWVDCYVRGLNPSADEGSIYGAMLEALKARGGISEFEHPGGGIHTAWDLGHDDATAIWFFRIGPLGVDVVDHYESHGRPMSHYFAKLREWTDERGYSYQNHWLPHDARAKTLQTGQSILDMCLEEWGASKVDIVPQLSVQDGISAARWLMEREGYDSENEKTRGPLLRFHERCSAINDDRDTDGLKCLRSYKRKWDEVRKVYSVDPVHDWSSHTADGFRYLSVVAKEISASAVRSRRKSEPKPAAKPLHYSISLDELWDAAPARSRRIG